MPTTQLSQIVAIDGPAGAGKSTVARHVAQALGFAFLDSGAMYRAATWWALHQSIDPNDTDALIESTRAMDFRVEEGKEGQRIFVGQHDITDEIRSSEVTQKIHHLDQIPEIRAHLRTLQRACGEKSPTVAEGRDMSTVVFPNAKCKIFLEANIDERAERRAAELKSKGLPANLEDVKADIEQRDEQNRTRSIAPLRPADDATHVDTTGMTIDEVVKSIVAIAREVL